MSEDEAIEILKRITVTSFNTDTIYDTVGKINDAIQGILDLYNKEKEKNIKLDREIKKRQWIKVKENGEIELLFYISKDKIKAKIKELEKRYTEHCYFQYDKK